MFPMTITLQTPAQLHAVMAALAGPVPDAPPAKAQPDPKPEAKPEATPEKPKAEKTAAPKQEKAVTAQPTAEAAKAAAPAQKDEPSTKAVTYDQVKAVILGTSAKKGRAAAMTLLEKFGVKAGPELKPEQYADFLAAAEVAA